MIQPLTLRFLFGLAVALLPMEEALADRYVVIFEEGEYTFNRSSGPDDVDNKYLARVTIKKNGQVLASNLRGSTLPDAWVFYHYWHVERGEGYAPTDADILAMFERLDLRSRNLRDSNAYLGNTRLADIADILTVLNRVPVLMSGEYPFVMGLHRDGRSVHGNPYVPRLLGGPQENPYDPSETSSRRDMIGGYIQTMNKNNAQAQREIASGINVHRGRRTQDYKDSEGCLTIHPDDWSNFHTSLPSPDRWSQEQHEGVVLLRREARPPPPSCSSAPRLGS